MTRVKTLVEVEIPLRTARPSRGDQSQEVRPAGRPRTEESEETDEDLHASHLRTVGFVMYFDEVLKGGEGGIRGADSQLRFRVRTTFELWTVATLILFKKMTHY